MDRLCWFNHGFGPSGNYGAPRGKHWQQDNGKICNIHLNKRIHFRVSGLYLMPVVTERDREIYMHMVQRDRAMLSIKNK